MAQSLSSVLRTATHDYLATINPMNPPSPSQIEIDLLDETKKLIMMENAVRAKGDKLPIPQRLDIWQIASLMAYLYPIRRIAGAGLSNNPEYDILAVYQEDGPDEGIYVSAENNFRQMAREFDVKINTREFAECMVILGDMVQRVERSTDRDLIAVNNGIFDYSAKKLLPFSKDIVFTSKSHVDYNPNATNVTIHNPDDGTDWDVESWMHTLSDDDDVVHVLWEIMGAIIRPNVAWGKAAWFYDANETGNNGKGTLCELMRQLCGANTVASIALSEMGKDFVLEPLITASAIIVDENDVGTFIDKAANLKAIVTNDVIQINRKFKQAISYRFRGFMVQCFNEMPRVKDKSDSFCRRQLFVPFEKCFTGAERKYIKHDYLHRKEVLEYVLHKVLHMTYYSLSTPDASLKVLNEFKLSNDPVKQFWDDIGPRLVWELVPSNFLYDLYRAWFDKNIPGGTKIGKNKFLKDIRLLTADGWHWPTNFVKRSNRMSLPEPMIMEYNLKDWMNMRYSGSQDLAKLCVPPNIAAGYRGMLRGKAPENQSSDTE